MSKRCLYCYEHLDSSSEIAAEYHSACSRAIYGSTTAPTISLAQEDIEALAQHIVDHNQSVTGVQPKLSLQLSDLSGVEAPTRKTMIGLYGNYILKPQTSDFKELPEIEDLTMHLASISGIATVPHSLIRLQSGELAYITRRVDRAAGRKYHMEDMCQLSEQLTEHKYRGSYEKISRIIRDHSLSPGLDVVNFYEMVLFSFLTGNNDMHLKNFSLLQNENGDYQLCPAYDLVASELLIEGDDEELALHLNGKKKRINRRDFEMAMSASGLRKEVIKNILHKFSGLQQVWADLVAKSFLSDTMKSNYLDMLRHKFTSIYSEN